MKTETKHTPGPWKYNNDTDMIVSVHPEWNWSCIAKLATGEDSTQEDSNARLIAAAPELLAALEGVLRVADRKTDEFDAARAAIAKARGETEVRIPEPK